MADKQVAEKKQKVKKVKSGKKGAGSQKVFVIIVIAFIVLALIGTSFAGIIANRNNSNSTMGAKDYWGIYNGTKIDYATDLFYNNLYQSYYYQYQDYADANDHSFWQSLYNEAVLYTRAMQMAAADDVQAPEEIVDEFIKNSGYFDDEEGNFSQEIYDSTEGSTKLSLQQLAKKQIPASIIISDLTTVATADSETAFIASLASDLRSFEYIAIGSEAIADFEAVSYLAANPDLFVQGDFALYTGTSEEELNAAVEAGTHSDATLVAYDLDDYFTEDEVKQILGLAAGEQVTLQSNGYWYTFVAESGAKTSELYAVKNYMYETDPETYFAAIQETANKVGDAIASGTDFAVAATQNGLSIHTTTPSAAALGEGLYMSSLQYADPDAYLAAVADEDLLREIYNAEVGYVTAPVEKDGIYVIVRVASDENSDASSITELVSTYYGNTINYYDLYASTLTSDKHDDSEFENKYYSVYLQSLLNGLTLE